MIAAHGEVKSDMAILDGRSQTKKKECAGGGKIADIVLNRAGPAACMLLPWVRGSRIPPTWSGQRLFFGVRWTICALGLVM